MSAGRACRPLPAAWRSAQHVHPEKSPSDLRPRPHPFGPLLHVVTFTSGRPVLRRPRSTRSSAGAFWPMAAPHPSSVLAPPSPWRRRQPCRRRRASPCARCRTGGDGLHQVLTDLAPVWPPSTARPSGSASALQRHRPLHVLAGVLALAAAARALVAVSTIISSVSSWAVVHAPGRAGGAGKRG